ncbi:MAG TPA: efflux RND transporter periplasmic adaptor subunit [Reyranella sp.]|nr:efflux RND transporter periplasmic adaptor subunit [Reyranella sp.]
MLSRFGAAFLVIGLIVAGYIVIDQMGRDRARAAAARPTPAIPVTVATAETKDIPIIVRGIGTVQAYKSVVIKTRVDGQIVKVAFEEGQFVHAGDLLFQIDPKPFQAALDHAAAAKRRDEAQLAGARLDLERYGKLIGSGFQSRQSFDQQQATVDALMATVALDEAAVETAKVNLSYTEIRAPVDARTGQRLVDLGNMVQASSPAPLVNLTQVKPIYVNFTVPQDVTDEVRRNQAIAPLTVLAYASDDKTLLSEGKLTLIDNQIDTATGTLRLKATFENTDERLWPGQFVNARLVISTKTAAITVPQRAVMQGATGYYAYIVKPEDTVERRVLEVAGMQDDMAVVEKGLAAGEKIVVDGQYRLNDGAHIKIDTAPPPAPAPAGAPTPQAVQPNSRPQNAAPPHPAPSTAAAPNKSG